MPIDHEVPGIDAWVEVNGRKAEVFDDHDVSARELDEEPAKHQIFKYIESADDAVFTVQVDIRGQVIRNAPPPCNTVIGELYVDGEYIAGRCSPVRLGPVVPDRFRFEAKRVNSRSRPGYVRLLKLVFSSVSTVDDTDAARIAKDLKTAKHLGLIQLRFFAGVDVGDASDRRFDSRASRTLSELAEKSLKGKAISHGTSFSKGGYEPAGQHVKIDYPFGKRPFAVINFKYRSRKALQQELIIPRTPSPDPELEVLEGMSNEQVRRLAAQRLRSMNGPSRVKAENATSSKDESKTSLKRERDEIDLTAPRAKREWKYTRTESGVRAIDLTEDDD